MIEKTAKIKIPYDINSDKKVNIQDITIVAMAYGRKPGDLKWKDEADLNNDGTRNIVDVNMVARTYGKEFYTS